QASASFLRKREGLQELARGMPIDGRTRDARSIMPMPKLRPFYYGGLLCAGLATAAFAPGCAARRYYYSGYQRDYYRGGGRRAYENGYADGLKQGERDARGHRAFWFERHDAYRDADDGYHRDYGDREFYRRAFRQGFQGGYSAGYSRIATERGYPYAPPPAPAYSYTAPPPGSAPYAGAPYPAGSAPAYVSPAAQN